MNEPKKRFFRADAIAVVKEVIAILEDRVERLVVAGSLRRGKRDVGDAEIVYIPKIQTVSNPHDLFGETVPIDINLADQALDQIIADGTISKRLNALGSEMWGAKNKLALHTETGIPIDLFAANHENWFNYLVCRTGGKETNQRICRAALAKGWKWHPYDSGFEDKTGKIIPVTCEQDVFHLVGLTYLVPHQRP